MAEAPAATATTTPATSAAAPNATTSAPAGTVLGTEAVVAGKSTETATQGDKPAATGAKSDEKPSADGKPADTSKPIEYAEFKIPEGFKPDEKSLNEFKEFAKVQGLTQAQAQALIDQQATTATKSTEAAAKRFTDMRTAWSDDLAKDKDFGGDKLTETVTLAKKAIEKFGSRELKDLLNKSGFGDNPDLIKTFARIGKQISEDSKVVTGVRQAGEKPKDAATALYPKQ